MEATDLHDMTIAEFVGLDSGELEIGSREAEDLDSLDRVFEEIRQQAEIGEEYCSSEYQYRSREER